MVVKKQSGDIWEFNGTGTVNGESAVSAKLVLEAFNLSDRNPALAEGPMLHSNVKSLSADLFKQIWTSSAA